jgi:predicted ATPase
MLQGAPALRCLVTSRQRLLLSGEREVIVSPLPTPGPVATDSQDGTITRRAAIDVLSANESVQLFIDRAQAARPDFQLTEANAETLACLCDRLEGIPLAIELAASRAQLLTPSQMLTQLTSRFEFLVSRQRDASARHRTLHGALDWSHQLLTAPLKLLFRQLSVFRGGWTPASVVEVCESGSAGRPLPGDGGVGVDLIESLAQLRESSLVTMAEDDDGMRMQMLETVRDFAAAQLSSEEASLLQRRHAVYYASLAEAAQGIRTGPDQKQWLNRLDREAQNLRAALTWSLANDQRVALQLVASLWPFWMARGDLKHGREWLKRVLDEDQAVSAGESQAAGSGFKGLDHAGLRARALFGAAVLAHLQSQDDLAWSFVEESRQLFHEAKDRWNLAELLGYAADILDAQGRLSEATQQYEEALALSRMTGNARGVAYAMSGLGRLQLEAHRDDQAASVLLEESLTIYRRLGDLRHVSMVLWQLGNLAVLRQQYDQAALHFEEDLALSREIRDVRHIAAGLCNLGTLRRIQQEYASADAMFAEALTLHRQMGQKRGVAAALTGLARVAMERQDHLRARELHLESLKILRELRESQGMAETLICLGFVATELGEYRSAHTFLSEGLAIGEASVYKRYAAWALEGFAALMTAQGRGEGAARLHGAAEALRESLSAPLPECERSRYEASVRKAQCLLAPDGFARAWALGRELTLPQAIAYVHNVDAAID